MFFSMIRYRNKAMSEPAKNKVLVVQLTAEEAERVTAKRTTGAK